ncbi:MAG: AbrB/MazE/SpoVT family DNA-binding domain-containing protein [Candidatus Shapirobacteria bacterium]|jgi:AbrB family looped-hinge helix DNA binding protein
MNRLVTITPKFQIHIPTAIRKKVGIKGHGMAKITVRKGKIILEPLKDEISVLAGKYKVKKIIPASKLREKIDYSKW